MSDGDEPTKKRVLLTGAEGRIGEVLRHRLGDRYAFTALTREPAAFPSHVGDITDLEGIAPAFEAGSRVCVARCASVAAIATTSAGARSRNVLNGVMTGHRVASHKRLLQPRALPVLRAVCDAARASPRSPGRRCPATH